MNKKIAITIGILIILIACGFYYFNRADKSEYEWRTRPIERGDLSIVIDATGTMMPDTTVNVGTQVSGTISHIYVDFNSHVRKGMILAVLDTTALYQAVQQAEAEERNASAQLLQARLTFQRAAKLYKRQLAAESDYDQDSVAYIVAKNTLQSSRTQLQRAHINLGYATIRAPIDGIVLSRDVDVGQTVAASFNTPQLFSIATDLHSMQISASVDEADIGQIKRGQQVTFNVDAFPDETFTGEVSQIRLQPVTTSDVVTYTVIINVQNPQLKLMPGMTANLTVHVQEDKDVLKVPAIALSFRPPSGYLAGLKSTSGSTGRHPRGSGTGAEATGKPAYLMERPVDVPGSKGTLWIKAGDRIIPKKVTLGLSDGTYTEVSGDGIHAGDLVVMGTIRSSGSSAPRSPFGRR